jgi:carotenoid cleavage dioxygenase
MNSGLILGFLPWIFLAAMPTHTKMELSISVVIALVLTIVFSFKDLKRGFILPWGTLLFFIFSAVTLIIFDMDWVAVHMGVLVPAMLALIAWSSFLVNKPFTLQYAKQQVPKEKWDHPVFIFINRVLTSSWGIIFLFNLGMNLLRQFYGLEHWVCSLTTDITSIGGLWFTIWFPKFYKHYVARRLSHESTSH